MIANVSGHCSVTEDNTFLDGVVTRASHLVKQSDLTLVQTKPPGYAPSLPKIYFKNILWMVHGL